MLCISAVLSRAEIKVKIRKVSVNLKRLSKDDLIKYNCHQASENLDSEAEVLNSSHDGDPEDEETTEPYGIHYKERYYQLSKLVSVCLLSLLWGYLKQL